MDEFEYKRHDDLFNFILEERDQKRESELSEEVFDKELQQLYFGDCEHEDMFDHDLEFCPECDMTMAEIQADQIDLNESR